MWQLTKDEAVFTGGGFSLSVTPADSAAGGRLTLPSNAPVACPLWAWAPVGHEAPTLREAYTRGADLVLQYGPREDFPFHTDVYWRCEPAAASEASVISLVLSIRTHKLDTHPVYEVHSSLNAPAPLGLADGAPLGTLVTAGDNSWSLVETIQPGDLNPDSSPAAVVEAATVRTRWRLFDLFMEKGVIRTARLSLALAPGGMTSSEALRAVHQLRAQPAPLST